jgi:UDP:flavonoid glycosyltransferase YjiC (YdhE family)
MLIHNTAFTERVLTKFLFTTLPTNDLGLLTRSLPIARELVARGHKILFCSPAQAPSRLIADAGFGNLLPKHPIYDLMGANQKLKGLVEFITSGKHTQRYGNLFNFLRQLIPAIPIKFAPQTREVWNFDHTGAIMGMLNTGFVRANCEALKNTISASAADVVVDFLNPFAVIAARALRKPVVTVIQGNFHPESGGFIWWKSPPSKLPTCVPTINKVLANYRLLPVHALEELCVGDLTLSVGTPETDPLPESANVNYIGAVLWQTENAQLPHWFAKLNPAKSVIWVYSGNPRYGGANDIFDSMVVLQACIAALANEDLQVVLTTGLHALPEELLPLPANFHHEAYMPGLAMAEASDVLIHHGGYGSCQTGLYAGKPSVIIPTFSERESNARRIAALGAGAIVPIDMAPGEKRVNVEELRAAVKRVLTDPSFRNNARQIGERLRAYGGASQAANLIEQFTQKGNVR